jgi:hypothetical protein
LAGGTVYAEWAADLLLQGEHRFFCGRNTDSVWVAREVLQAVSHDISDDRFVRLEDAVRDLRFPWESRRGGWYAFTLLSALDEHRLSELGRRRLGEYRRLFGLEQPPEPEGVTGGWIGPPIAPVAAMRMRDANWLTAIQQYSTEREHWQTLTGGARELSHVLRERTKEEPARFAQLALQLTGEANSAYGDAILMGLGDASPLENETLAFDAIRHIASFNISDNDRWLGWSLRPYMKRI